MEVWHLLIALVYIISAILFFKYDSDNCLLEWNGILFIGTTACLLLGLLVGIITYLLKNVDWSWLTYKLF